MGLWILILILSIPVIWIIYGTIKGSSAERGLIEDIKDLKPFSKKTIKNEKGEFETVEKTFSEKLNDWTRVILGVVVFLILLAILYFLAYIGGWDVVNIP